MKQFDFTKVRRYSLKDRKSKSDIEDITIDPHSLPETSKYHDTLENIAATIRRARSNDGQVIVTYGAHLVKNGLSRILKELVEKNIVTHIATNGAGSIHDWELAYHGKTEESVRENALKGEFGVAKETGRYMNLAISEGARLNLGLGEAIGRMIHDEKLEGEHLPHKYPRHSSLLESAYANHVPITIHPCLGQDIIDIHPEADWGAKGKTAHVDFKRFVHSVSQLQGGVYISIGSAIMSPMIFEKAISAARNVAHQKESKISDFMVIVNDINKSSEWQWGTGQEPPKEDPAYYLRFCKTFDRMGAREMHYIQEDNRIFLHNLYHLLTKPQTQSLSSLPSHPH